MKDSVIIGYGPAGVILTQKLTEAFPDLPIRIFDSGKRSAAFTQKTDAFLLNTKVQDMDLSSAYSFKQFLFDRNSFTQRDFVPRYLYGEYLEHFREQHRQNPRIVIHDEEILSTDSRLKNHQVFYCGGEVKPKSLAIRHPNIFEFPWDLNALSTLKANSRILCVGSSLSFLDVLTFLKDGNHQITVLSRTKAQLLGHHSTVMELPASVIQSLSQSFRLRSLVKVFRSLTDEERYAAVKWIRGNQAIIWSGFSKREKAQFQKWASSYWRVNRHRAPPESIQLMKEMIRQGTLRFAYGKAELQDLHSYDYVINASGFTLPIPLSTDHDYRTVDGIFVVGARNFENHFESNAVPDFIKQANKVVAAYEKT